MIGQGKWLLLAMPCASVVWSVPAHAEATLDGGSAEDDASTKPKPASDPATWILFSDYPLEARRAIHEGTTEVRLAIGADGKPTACTVITSSGDASLDAATCTALQTRARYNRGAPGRLDTRKVTWRIPDADGTGTASFIPAEPIVITARRAKSVGTAEARLAIGVDGKPTACTVITSSGDASLDAATCRVLQTRARYDRGAPGRSVTQKVTWRIADADETGTTSSETGTTSFIPIEPIEVTRTVMRDSVIEVEATIGFDGAIESCRVTERDGDGAGADPCAMFPVGRKMGVGYVRDGKPIRAIIRQRVTLSTRFPDERDSPDRKDGSSEN